MPKAADATQETTPEIIVDAPAVDIDAGMLEAVQVAFEEPAADPDPGAVDDPTAAATEPPAGDNPAEPPAEKTDDEKAVEAAAVEAAAVAAAAKEDEGLPEGVKEKTRERFEQLTTQKKDVEAKLAEAATERDTLRENAKAWDAAIADTGATPEQYGGALLYLKHINAGTRQGLETAYEMMMSEVKQIATILGKEAPGVDPLAAHPDLVEKVDGALIDRATALELAASRQGRALETSLTQRQQDAVADQRARVEGGESIKAIASQLRAADPHYEAKSGAFAAIITPIMESGLPPAKWAAAFQLAYHSLPNPAAPPSAVVTQIRPDPKVPDPIRSGGQASTTAAPEPKSLEEAMRRAWA